MSVRVLIVDDYATWRSYVCDVLEEKSGVNIVSENRDAASAVRNAAELQPDVIVLGLGVADRDGLNAARQLRRCVPRAKIIFLTETKELEVVRKALMIGAHAYVLKSTAARDLMPALDAVLHGCRFVSDSAMQATDEN